MNALSTIMKAVFWVCMVIFTVYAFMALFDPINIFMALFALTTAAFVEVSREVIMWRLGKDDND